MHMMPQMNHQILQRTVIFQAVEIILIRLESQLHLLPVGEKFDWLFGDKVSKGANNISKKGLDMVESKYPVINKPVDELPDYSKQAATNKLFSYIGLNKSKVSENPEQTKTSKEKEDSELFSLKSTVSVEMKTPDGTSYEMRYVPFNLKDNFMYKTITNLWPKKE